MRPRRRPALRAGTHGLLATGLPTAAVLSALAALVLFGCGGGGGGPTSPPPPPPPPPPASGVTFTADGTAPANSVALQAGPRDAPDFVLEVRVRDVVDLYGVSFDLAYPADLLRFLSARVTEGDFLPAGGADTELLVANRPQGNLVIGYTRIGDTPGAEGSGLLLTLEFSASADGNGRFTIDQNTAFDSAGEPQGDVTWVSGSVQVNAP